MPPTVTSVAVSGTSSFTEAGASSQLSARVTLSDGATEDRTNSATWQTDNAVVATVSSQGLVTILSSGDTSIGATVSGVRGALAISVRIPARTPDPPAGQRIPLPDVRAFIQQSANARPELIAQSCPTGLKYQNNPWLDYMVDRLRTLDTRWGYNGKPTRTAADNGGQPVIAAGDEVAFHYGAGPDQNSPAVYLIDLLEGHCGATPRLTYREFTGEEPGFWTGAGRLR
ncbi:MAG: Ig-like domain-containing protein [Vicinamibacterales bacterium]